MSLRFVRLLGLLGLLLGGGCGGADGPPVTEVRAAFVLSAGGVAKGGSVTPADRVDLTERPCYVGLRVTAPDLLAPVTAAWACDPGEAPAGQVDLTLEVASGVDRVLTGVAFLMEGDRVLTFVGSPAPIDLTPGAADLALTVTEATTGAVDLALVGGPEDLAALQLMDLQTGVFFPASPVEPSDGGHRVTLPEVPQGRFFQPVLRRASGAAEAMEDCAIYAIPGATRQVTLTVLDGSC
jgi:hypothetical protein